MTPGTSPGPGIPVSALAALLRTAPDGMVTLTTDGSNSPATQRWPGITATDHDQMPAPGARIALNKYSN